MKTNGFHEFIYTKAAVIRDDYAILKKHRDGFLRHYHMATHPHLPCGGGKGLLHQDHRYLSH